MTATVTELAFLGDLTTEIPCEDPQHEGGHRADLRARFRCPCGGGWTRHLCRLSWIEYRQSYVWHRPGCDGSYPNRDTLTLLEFLR